MRSKNNDLRRYPETQERRGEIIRRSGARVAQILSDDQIGLESSEKLGVDRVDAFAAADQFAHLPIDFGGRRFWVYSRPDQRRFFGGFGRVVTFVRHADDPIAEAEGVKNFGSGRK